MIKSLAGDPGGLSGLTPSSPSARKPSVPQPGQPRIPSPTSTVNTLELIGSPVSNRPRVQQPRGESSLSPGLRNRIPKYENTPGPELAVAMPGTPSQSVKVGLFSKTILSLEILRHFYQGHFFIQGLYKWVF